MVIIETTNGDLLNASETYIAQQCNVTVKPHGLSMSISNRWIHGNIYQSRSKKSANTALKPDTRERL